MSGCEGGTRRKRCRDAPEGGQLAAAQILFNSRQRQTGARAPAVVLKHVSVTGERWARRHTCGAVVIRRPRWTLSPLAPPVATPLPCLAAIRSLCPPCSRSPFSACLHRVTTYILYSCIRNPQSAIRNPHVALAPGFPCEPAARNCESHPGRNYRLTRRLGPMPRCKPCLLFRLFFLLLLKLFPYDYVTINFPFSGGVTKAMSPAI